MKCKLHCIRFVLMSALIIGSIMITTGVGSQFIIKGMNTCRAERLILDRDLLVLPGVQLFVVIWLTIGWLLYGLWSMCSGYNKLQDVYIGLIPLIALTALGLFIILMIDRYPSSNQMKALMSKFDSDSELQEELHRIQSTLHCCGKNSYLDWNRTSVVDGNPWWSQIPHSCRKQDEGNDWECYTIDHKLKPTRRNYGSEKTTLNFVNDFYTEGCQFKLDKHRNVFLHFFTYVGAILFAVQVVYAAVVMWTYETWKRRHSATPENNSLLHRDRDPTAEMESQSKGECEPIAEIDSQSQRECEPTAEIDSQSHKEREPTSKIDSQTQWECEPTAEIDTQSPKLLFQTAENVDSNAVEIELAVRSNESDTKL